MSNPTSTQLPDGWEFTDSTFTTATAPDGSQATGDVLVYVTGAVTQIATLQQQLDSNALAQQVAQNTQDIVTLKQTVSGLTGELTTDEATISADVAALSNVQTAETNDAAAITTLTGEVTTLETEEGNATAAATLEELVKDIEADPALQPAAPATGESDTSQS